MPAAFLKADKLEQYEAEMAYFHGRLSELHHNIYYVQHILDFPFDLFVNPVEDLFLRFVVHNFFQVSVLQITKLTTDSGGDAHTLSHFNTFMNSAVKDEYLRDYRDRLKESKVNPRIERLIATATRLRDKTIAHWVPTDKMDTLTFDQIKDIVAELTKLFDVASFATECHYLSVYYDPAARPPAGADSRPDIERILDGIARDSDMLHLPERSPEAWPHAFKTWSAVKVERFNRYRRRCGLPEV